VIGAGETGPRRFGDYLQLDASRDAVHRLRRRQGGRISIARLASTPTVREVRGLTPPRSAENWVSAMRR